MPLIRTHYVDCTQGNSLIRYGHLNLEMDYVISLILWFIIVILYICSQWCAWNLLPMFTCKPLYLSCLLHYDVAVGKKKDKYEILMGKILKRHCMALLQNALRQQRFVREVTIQYNLCNEPW